MTRLRTALWLWLLLLSALMLPGCSGCRPDPLVERKKTLEDEEKKKEKPKDDFEFRIPRTVPGDETLAASTAKPGHWVTVAHDVKANNFNFQAELHTRATDKNDRPFEIPDTNFVLSSSRPAPLPKGQERRFETISYVPVRDGDTRTVGFDRQLRAARGGRLLKKDWQPLLDMEPYQYYFLVLASDPDRYGYLKRLTSVAAPTSEDFEKEEYLYYRVLLPQLDRIAPLPSNPLTWTSIAFILWDDVDPLTLTPDQRTAMLDWLHWGGQLIVSGPNSLEKLNGTFLAEYLPAKATRTVEIDQQAVDAINDYWALPDKKEGGKRTLDLVPGQPLVGVALERQLPGEFVPHTGELVAERRVGGGRIVVTAFSLTDRPLLRWGSYDSFFNACLLRRPRRHFSFNEFLLDAQWTDHHRMAVKDSRLVTTLRYFSRDIGHFASTTQASRSNKPNHPDATSRATSDTVISPGRRQRPSLPAVVTAVQPPAAVEKSTSDEEPTGDDWHFNGYPLRQHGMAAWDDHSGAADASREALAVAKGFSIPKGEFVLKVLIGYLLVLAPLNWALFRLIGRVEWAWVAAPLLSVLGAVAVVRLAQLDIGFARSVTEVGIAEVHGDYPRVHLTRFTNMYTSLATPYDLAFEDEASLAQPLSGTGSPKEGQYTVSLRRDRELRLSGFQVGSNSTGTVHCEQMVDLGGSLRLSSAGQGLQIVNGSGLQLQDVGIVLRNEQGNYERAWVGELPKGAILPLRLERTSWEQIRCPQWDQSDVTRSFERQVDLAFAEYDTDKDDKLQRAEVASNAAMSAAFDRFDRERQGIWDRGEALSWCRGERSGDLTLGQLFDMAIEGLRLRPGDARLVGWTEEPLPGMEIRPTASQQVRRTLFVVHLQNGPLPEPQPDLNCVADFADKRPRVQLDENDPEATEFETPLQQP